MKATFQNLRIAALMLLLAAALGTTACARKGTMEKVGEKADDAIEDVKDKAEDVGDKVEDAADKLDD